MPFIFHYSFLLIECFFCIFFFRFRFRFCLCPLVLQNDAAPDPVPIRRAGAIAYEMIYRVVYCVRVFVTHDCRHVYIIRSSTSTNNAYPSDITKSINCATTYNHTQTIQTHKMCARCDLFVLTPNLIPFNERTPIIINQSCILKSYRHIVIAIIYLQHEYHSQWPSLHTLLTQLHTLILIHPHNHCDSTISTTTTHAALIIYAWDVCYLFPIFHGFSYHSNLPNIFQFVCASCYFTSLVICLFVRLYFGCYFYCVYSPVRSLVWMEIRRHLREKKKTFNFVYLVTSFCSFRFDEFLLNCFVDLNRRICYCCCGCCCYCCDVCVFVFGAFIAYHILVAHHYLYSIASTNSQTIVD